MSKKTGLMIIILALAFGGWVYWSIKNNEADLNKVYPESYENNPAPSAPVPTQFLGWLNNLKQIGQDEGLDKGETSTIPAANPEEILKPEDVVGSAGGAAASRISKGALFARLWPAAYIERLKEWQSMMINDGFLKENEKKDFKNSEEIYGFLEKSIDYWLNIGVIKSEQKDKKIAGIEKLKKLKIEEAESFVQQKSQSLINRENNRCAEDFKENVFAKNFSTLLKPFSDILGWSRPVFAQFIMCPDCWKLGAGVGPVCGASLWAPCCNCYCGKSPCGCLNAVCSCCNAIWDCETGICGCDIIGGC